MIARRFAEVLAQARAMIDEYGFYVQAVFADEDSPPYSYTVGLSFGKDIRHPEIVVLGMQPEMAHVILVSVAQRIMAGEKFERTTFDSEVLNVPAAFRPVMRDGVVEHLTQALNHAGDVEVEAVQLIWPDRDGFFPWQPECAVGVAKSQNALFEYKEPPPMKAFN